MIRKIIKIDSEKCNGCGKCASACHEGAIGMLNGKAVLMRDDYCDGLGDCLPACPTGAITFEEREAAAYDEAAVKANMAKNGKTFHGCPGSMSRSISHTENVHETFSERPLESRLGQWPVQIKLAPVNAPYFDGCKLLIAADCTAFAYGNFHNDFISGHVTLIGCPKLDMTDYSEKLAEIIKNNDIKSVKVARMEVPCCGGIENAVKKALIDSGKFIPWSVVTISTDGKITETK
ncbi:4Fe-4S binding protein [Lachnospiraceae bacterium NSJ-143]|nr:4Fe-4S binding protein [Lachnospiraceae bacterium NSJ-143]